MTTPLSVFSELGSMTMIIYSISPSAIEWEAGASYKEMLARCSWRLEVIVASHIFPFHQFLKAHAK